MENLVLDDQFGNQELNQHNEYTIANSGKRFGNYIIDLVITYFIIFVVGMGYALVTQLSEMNQVVSYIIGILVIVTYYTILESINGKTIGKMITGTRVLNDDFSKPSLGTIFKRSWCRIIPFEAFSFLGSSGGWHDTISDTVVVID